MANLTKTSGSEISEIKIGDSFELVEVKNKGRYEDVFTENKQFIAKRWLPNITNLGYDTFIFLSKAIKTLYFTESESKVIGRFVIKSLKGGNHGL